MASFSRPVNEDDSIPAGSSEPGKRTRTTSTRLTNADNISKDAKKRTLEQAARGNIVAPSTSKPTVQQTINFASQSKKKPPTTFQPSTRHSSVEIEEIPDEESSPHRHAGPPKNPTSLLEAADGSDDDADLPEHVLPPATRKRDKPVAEHDSEVNDTEEPASKKQKSETAEEELGQCFDDYMVTIWLTLYHEQNVFVKGGNPPCTPFSRLMSESTIQPTVAEHIFSSVLHDIAKEEVLILGR